jgi:hypothetical protein
MWPSTFFAFGTLIFALFAYHAKLYGFKGTKLRTRMIYGLGLSAFLTVIFFLQSDGEMHIIASGLGIGVILVPPLYFISRRQIENRMEGSIVYYKHRQYLRNLLWVMLLIIVLMAIFYKYQNFLTLSNILGLGFSFAAFLGQLFLVRHIARLEEKLGLPIMEDQM